MNMDSKSSHVWDDLSRGFLDITRDYLLDRRSIPQNHHTINEHKLDLKFADSIPQNHFTLQARVYFCALSL
jgi:hypothetical protein